MQINKLDDTKNWEGKVTGCSIEFPTPYKYAFDGIMVKDAKCTDVAKEINDAFAKAQK